MRRAADRVGKKIGEGSFGVVFEGQSFLFFFVFCLWAISSACEGTNLLNGAPVGRCHCVHAAHRY